MRAEDDRRLRNLHALGEVLHMPVSRILTELTAAEFDGWIKYFEEKERRLNG